MTVRCARCGEELLGAVNRCWKCGQQFAALPTVDGLPPVRAEIVAAVAAAEPTGPRVLEARVLEEASASQSAASEPTAAPPVAVLVAPPPMPAHPLSTPRPQRVAVAQPTNVAAVGGAYAAFLLGIFALAISGFRYEGAIVAFVGLLAGVWGIYSPRRNWALVGMLLCAVAMGLGTYTGARQLYLHFTR